jgi:pantoate--beta-alanine ligase
MQIVHELPQLRSVIAGWHREGQRIAFVPTMGNLHAGHLSLLAAARAVSTRTVVSIFVNPIQFGQGEDYARYPSTLEADRMQLEAAGLDLLFAPDLGVLYPGGFEQHLRIVVPVLDSILCGAFRPGHFSGVATVVAKLFANVQPDLALFGEKDYQQVLVVRRLVADLCLPIEVLAMPIIREPNGLAMSSRNQYLTAEERERAAVIHRTLLEAATAVGRNESLDSIEATSSATLASAGFRPEYVSIRRAVDLALPGADDVDLRILAAAWLGAARLIDNLPATRPRSLT